MSITHHPSDTLVGAFAAGTLDPGQHVAMATHLIACPRCRGFAQAMEQAGGAMLERLPPTTMAADALSRIEARLEAERDEPAPQARPASASLAAAEIPGLPDFVRRYPSGPWKFVAPSLHLKPIVLPQRSETRVFLLKAGPGSKLLQHTHTGVEMTCILTGAFSHDGGRYGPGDFDFGDETVDHQPVVEREAGCICLVAMTGELRLDGLLGRIMQPFVRL